MAIKQLFLALCLLFVEVTSSPLKKETSSIGFILGGSWYKTQSIGELQREILFVNSMNLGQYGEYLTTKVLI